MKQPGAEELQALHSALNQSHSPFQNLMAFNEFLPLAEMLSKSTIIHETFQGNPANCMLIIEIANRTNSPLVSVAQNLQLVNGKPAWSGKYVIAKLNSSGLFDRLKFQFVGERGSWDYGCFAYTTYAGTEDRVEGVHVTRRMVHDAGWEYTGSPWLSMPDLMFHYRAASFFVNVNAPELLLGLPSVEEAYDTSHAARPPVISFTAPPPQTSSLSRVREMLDKAPLPPTPQLVEVTVPNPRPTTEASVVQEESEAKVQATVPAPQAKQPRQPRTAKKSDRSAQAPADLELFGGSGAVEASPSESPASVATTVSLQTAQIEAASANSEATIAPTSKDEGAVASTAVSSTAVSEVAEVVGVPPHVLDGDHVFPAGATADQHEVARASEDSGFFLGGEVEQETIQSSQSTSEAVSAPAPKLTMTLATIKEMCLRAESASALSEVAVALENVDPVDRSNAESELLETALIVLGELDSAKGKEYVVKAMTDLGAIAAHLTSKDRYNTFVGAYNARTKMFNAMFPQ